MKIRNLLPALLALSCSSAPEAPPPRAAIESVAAVAPVAGGADVERLRAHVAWLADDAQEGRRAGTEAGRRSGHWIAERLGELGLEPAGGDGFLQSFEVPLPVRDGGGSRLTFLGRELHGAQHLVPLFCSDGAEAEGPLAWRGYGIVDEERGHDDYAAGSVEGAVVLIVRGAPELPEVEEGEEADDTALVHSGPGWGNSASLFTKVMNAKRRGAVAVLIAEHPESALEPLAFDVSRSAQSNIPALFLTAAAARDLSQGYPELVRIADGKPVPAAIFAPTPVHVVADVRREKGEALNVLARLPGAKRGRTVVLGAHYDHLGHGGDGSLAPDEQGQIHNGADDNASGTAAVIEMARLLCEGPRPEGDVVFALWDGEELGLLGSEHWAKNPTLPLESVAANINLDMVGRAGDGVLTVLGAGTAEPFGGWLDAAAPAVGLELKVSQSGQGVGGSDHQTFLKREIPALHFFSGIHTDYHKPSDDVERFEAEGTGRVVELGVELVRRMQSVPELAFVVVEAEEAETQRVTGGWRVWFGSVPEYSYEGVGLLLAGTSAGSPAEKAGLLKDDVILQVGEVEVENIYDFMHALQTYKPGDVVLTRFLRDDGEQEVRVTLATRDAH